jgi:hypothetical protein
MMFLLAGALSSVHTKFGIANKVVSTTTDNASNFVKAFRMFGSVDEDLDEEDTVDEDLVCPVSITATLVNQRSNGRGTNVNNNYPSPMLCLSLIDSHCNQECTKCRIRFTIQKVESFILS